MLLFGPPGTGKTSFAKAVAGRLGWPFVEILPSKLGAEGLAMMADELHNAFEELLSLEHAVIFIDEVDDIASSRAERPESQAVVNELLKAVVGYVRPVAGCSYAPRTRSEALTLLLCAPDGSISFFPSVLPTQKLGPRCSVECSNQFRRPWLMPLTLSRRPRD
jgi:hypothetical protein